MVVDPALRQAAKDMSTGYEVRSLAQEARGVAGRPGSGQQDAAAWLEELSSLRSVQHVTSLPWGNPATSSLAAAHMRGVGQRGRQRRASSTRRPARSTRQSSTGSPTAPLRGGAGRRPARRCERARRVAGQPPGPPLNKPSGYPPAVVGCADPAKAGDHGGRSKRHRRPPFVASLSALQFRQSLLAEATIRALSGDHRALRVRARRSTGTRATSRRRPTSPPASGTQRSARRAPGRPDPANPRPYSGRLRLRHGQPQLAAPIFATIRRLRHNGRVYNDLLDDPSAVTTVFDRQFAGAGSAAWSTQIVRGTAVIRELARQISTRVAQVTVTAPRSSPCRATAGGSR